MNRMSETVLIAPFHDVPKQSVVLRALERRFCFVVNAKGHDMSTDRKSCPGHTEARHVASLTSRVF